MNQVVKRLWCCLTEIKPITHFPGLWYIHLSLLIKTLLLDQGVLHSIGHVLFIVMEIGGYLQYRRCFKVGELPLLVFVSKTCAVLKSQMDRPDIIVCTFCFVKVSNGDCMPQLNLIILLCYICVPEKHSPRKWHAPQKPNGRYWKKRIHMFWNHVTILKSLNRYKPS